MQKNSKETTIKLSEFASIEVGYPLHRGMTLFEPYYTYKTYPNPSCSEQADTFCYVNPLPEQYLTREGDIIINTAKLKDVVLIDKEHEGLLVSDRYLIIRCNKAKAFPGYICYEMLHNSSCEKRKKICRDAVLTVAYVNITVFVECRIAVHYGRRTELRIGAAIRTADCILLFQSVFLLSSFGVV